MAFDLILSVHRVPYYEGRVLLPRPLLKGRDLSVCERDLICLSVCDYDSACMILSVQFCMSDLDYDSVCHTSGNLIRTLILSVIHLNSGSV